MAAVKRQQSGLPVGSVARELQVNPNQLHPWKRQFSEKPNSAFSGQGQRRGEETAVAELERKIGQQATECRTEVRDTRTSRRGTDLRAGNPI